MFLKGLYTVFKVLFFSPILGLETQIKNLANKDKENLENSIAFLIYAALRLLKG